MLDKTIEFDLPPPWAQQKFKTTKIGHVNFLVGPNGSGKSRFAQALKGHLGQVRFLGTDRLSGMEQVNGLRNIFGDPLQSGFEKNQFQNLKNAGEQGSGIDTLVVLEERADLRIQVEATLSHLFNRKMLLEWDSGKLVPHASFGEAGVSYRLDREECHGIKELLVLLTNLYNDQYHYLVIDEPELNLHPQYQAFFMQEVRKAAGDPGRGKKIVFLITHSPFILDFKSIDDLKSVISFSLDHKVPIQIYDLDHEKSSRIQSLVSRLNVHHKQLFFSDNPIFVEGILDAQFVAALQEARGVSIAGAGSCIIDAGGSEEVNKYLDLCIAFGKKAYFLYDLDSLFRGNLKACVTDETVVQGFLATAGVGGNFSKYCGELEKKLTSIIDGLLQTPPSSELATLSAYLQALGNRNSWDGKTWAKARVSVLTAISKYKAGMSEILGDTEIADVLGRLNTIVTALRERNVYLLPGGTLERYLPDYRGNPYDLKDEDKKKAVEGELTELSRTLTETELKNRYGELYEAVCQLPSMLSVDVDPVVRGYLSQYIHDLQKTIVDNPSWDEKHVQARLAQVEKPMSKVFSIRNLKKSDKKQFSATVVLVPMLGKGERYVLVNHTTNASMGDFEIREAEAGMA